MFKFSELRFKRHCHFLYTGVRALHTTDNGYTASVVKFPGSHGFNDGLYEMAIIKDGEVDYENALTPGDVLGHLTIEDVENYIAQMALLDPETGFLPEGTEYYKQKGTESEHSLKQNLQALKLALSSSLDDE